MRSTHATAEIGLARLSNDDNKDWEVGSDLSVFTSDLSQSALTVSPWSSRSCRCCCKTAVLTVAWGVPVGLLVAVVALLVPNAVGAGLVRVRTLEVQTLSLTARPTAEASPVNSSDETNCTADGSAIGNSTNAANGSSCVGANASGRAQPPPPPPPRRPPSAAADWGNPKAAFEGLEQLNQPSDGFFTAWWNRTRGKLLLEVPEAALGTTEFVVSAIASRGDGVRSLLHEPLTGTAARGACCLQSHSSLPWPPGLWLLVVAAWLRGAPRPGSRGRSGPSGRLRCSGP